MISTIKWISTDCTDPYRNLAAERQLTLSVREGECILFLWQNRRTVVIGRNQNAWEECRVRELLEDGGRLARRLSGGGAVYHDLGNLNFSFAARKADAGAEAQSEVILRAVRRLGIDAGRTGRNDLEAGGRKFSGNAYYETGGCRCGHGTIMMDVDTEAMGRYLRVSETKLKSRGVPSVRARVMNLKELCPDISAERMKNAIVEAFGEVYGLPPAEADPRCLDGEEILREAGKLGSEGWLFPPRIPFTAFLENRYGWGGIRIELCVRMNRIEQADCFSDAMEADLIRRIGEGLAGCRYDSGAAAARVREITAEPGEDGGRAALRRAMGEDIAELIRSRLP